MASAMKIIFGLLTIVTVGMIVGALFQLAFIHKLEDSYGIPQWENDKEAEILRLGHVKPEIISWLPRIIVLHSFLSMEPHQVKEKYQLCPCLKDDEVFDIVVPTLDGLMQTPKLIAPLLDF